MCDWGSTQLPSMIDDAVRFIHAACEKCAKILVHCEWGINRSATATVAYLVRHCDMSLRDALVHTRSKRAIIRPRQSYVEQLAILEREWRPNAAPETYMNPADATTIFNVLAFKRLPIARCKGGCKPNDSLTAAQIKACEEKCPQANYCSSANRVMASRLTIAAMPTGSWRRR